MPMRPFALFVLIAACGCNRDVPRFMARPGAKPTCSFELRRAEPTAKDEIVEQTLKGTHATFYLYPEVELSNADLLCTAVRVADNEADAARGPIVDLFLTKAGTRKLADLAKGCDPRDGPTDLEIWVEGKKAPAPLYVAVLIDGQLVVAPEVGAHVVTAGVIPLQMGFVSQAEAEKTARALVGE